MPTSKSSLAETLVIRPENAADPAECAAIADLVERAFRAVPESDGTEGALVALESERIVGHVLFSRMHVGGDTPAWALAPLAVTPEKQRMGIGSALVRRALERARQADKAPGAPRFVIVLGDPDY
ncbi:N-acetyltransferase [Sutterella massiliensis]|uniref:N-acetyltransferase n=1 Tax=Sutterella massiliensis TaxID=1816689 RepID=A0ABS2DUT0_9BURK|nr:N-acetyltransferase [Sutterella massiliensis]MBM6704485.1 N-acetyltransferase [Sutterella massiliensis]